MAFKSSKHTQILPPASKDIPRPNTNDGTKYLFISFRILGILMPKKNKLLYIIYSLIINFSIVVMLPLAFTISYFVGSEKMEIVYFITSFQVAINLYASAIKFITIAYMRRYLFKIEAILEKLDFRITCPEEINEAQKAIKFGHHVVIFLSIAYFTYTTITFIASIVNGRPPYSLYFPFLNWRDSMTNFIVASMMEYVLINLICIQETANDSYAIIYVGMVHSHLKILTMRVLRIGANSGLTQEENLKELVRCIHDHKNIIELIKSVAPVISPTVFVQYMVSAVVLSTALINIVISGDRSSIITSVFFIVAIVLEILPISYFVTSLIAESERLPNAIFHMNWVDQNREFRRLCLFFVHRSQQTMVFFAGKIFPITLNTFMGIIKFSFSLYTLLNTMDFRGRFN